MSGLPFDPGADTRAFRDALGRFATGVTLVTTVAPEGPVGLTANSFASVSLDPPLVLWCPARASSRFAHFAEANHFAIHVLSKAQQDIARGFTKSREDAFEGLDWAPSAEGVPLLEGCRARFLCETAATYGAGDHLIVVGRVLSVSLGTGAPLLFEGGRFLD